MCICSLLVKKHRNVEKMGAERPEVLLVMLKAIKFETYLGLETGTMRPSMCMRSSWSLGEPRAEFSLGREVLAPPQQPRLR